ncbi:MAG TPA: hypothetical protein VFY84_08105 [Jiangellales bacterium]|nr:hypothetical protein [Jiangellales bacterium]
MASADTFDVLVATDCRFPAGSTASVVDEIRAQARAGYRTGLLHLPSPLIGPHRSFAPALRQIIDEGTAALVTGHDNVTARLLLVRHPSVFDEPSTELPKISAERVLVVANAVPYGPGKYEQAYDVDRVAEQVERIIGVAPTWAPISPIVRDALAPLAGGRPMLTTDWEPVLDVDEWRVDRTGFVSDRPVLGRHTVDDWTKWPERRRELLAAYPDDPRYEVRVLGGTSTPVATLGYRPANWTELPFGAAPPQRFLAAVDFFVYFHHRKFIEPFGRAVLEALAAGAVAIVPPALEPIFGDACRYCRPSDVRQYVDELYADWDGYAAQSRAGTELVAKRFGAEAHLERLARLIGEPAEPVLEPPPALPRGTLVVDLTRGETIDSVVSSTVRATVDSGGPRIVAVPAARAADLTARVAVETFPRVLEQMPVADRRHYLRDRLTKIVSTHAPARVIVVDDGHGAARELCSDLDRVTTDLWLVHSGTGPSRLDDDIAVEIASILPPGWTIGPLPRSSASVAGSAAAQAGTDLGARTLLRLRQWAGRMNAAIRRRLLGWLRADAERAGLMLVELAGADHALLVRAGAGQSDAERLPVALVVVVDVYSDPPDGVRAIVERQLVAGTFRTALLVPPDWEPSAAAVGITVETYIPEQEWTLLYGSGWPAYFRRRVQEACQSVAAATVVFADRLAAGDEAVAAMLDVLEAARTRPPARS